MQFVFLRHMRNFRQWYSIMSSSTQCRDAWGSNFECVLIAMVYGKSVHILSQNPYELGSYRVFGDPMQVLMNLSREYLVQYPSSTVQSCNIPQNPPSIYILHHSAGDKYCCKL